MFPRRTRAWRCPSQQRASRTHAARSGQGCSVFVLLVALGLPLGLEDLVDEAVFLGLTGTHVEIAVDVALDLGSAPPRRVDQDLDDDVFRVANFARLNLDVRRLPARATQRLMDHDARMRQRETTTFL